VALACDSRQRLPKFMQSRI